ncbi:MAG: ATP-binding protein [Betaproteobacteria bacterium]
MLKRYWLEEACQMKHPLLFERARPAALARMAGRLVVAFLACVGVTLITEPLLAYLDLVKIALLYLLNVVMIAVWLGRWPAVFAALVSSLSFAHVFVPPHYSLAITEPTYLITAVEMLVVALVTGHLTAGLATKAEEAAQRERTLQALYAFATRLAGVIDAAGLAEVTRKFLAGGGHSVALLVLDEAGDLQTQDSGRIRGCLSLEAARRALEREELIEVKCASGLIRYFPLQAAGAGCGVLVTCSAHSGPEAPDERGRLATLASLVGVTLERVRYADMARDATLKAETEQLRSSILSALSHDIRTPLTSVIGLADTLARSVTRLEPGQQELLLELHGQALQMNSMVNNLLDMARLQAGRLCLQREWQPLEEVIGSSLEILKGRLAGRKLVLALEPELPLLEFDAVLIERVICNLLENALKFAPEGELRLEARRASDEVAVSVLDEGIGITPGREEQMFEMFVQGKRESANAGVGLGLAICRSIVAAHGGTIRAENRVPKGAVITFTLPVGIPPEAEEAPIEDEEGRP